MGGVMSSILEEEGRRLSGILTDEDFSKPELEKFYGLMRNLAEKTHYTDYEVPSFEPVRAGILKNLRIVEPIVEFTEEEIINIAIRLAPPKIRENLASNVPYFPVGFSFSIYEVGHFRVLLSKIKLGLILTIRRLSYVIPDWNLIGIPDYVKEAFLQGAGIVDECTGTTISGGQRGGLILVTGTMGSGKTTTINSMLKLIADSIPVVILTIENPIEYVHFNSRGIFKQMEVGSDVDTQEEALYHVLRSNCAVISLGEVRNAKELKMLINASEYGCLTTTSFHVPNAVAALERISAELNDDVAIRVLAETLIGVLNQKLLFLDEKDSPSGKPEFFLLCEWLPVNRIKPVKEFLIERKFGELKKGLEEGRWAGSGAVSMEQSLDLLLQSGRIGDNHEIFQRLRYTTGHNYDIYG